jgi:P27 family predicted phage terminase small subunit
VSLPPPFRRICPSSPEWLSSEARAEWDRVVPGLQRLDLLKEEDRGTLTAYCETWAVFVAATINISTRGLTVSQTITRKDGSIVELEVANPAVAIARNASRDLRAWAAHYGLTPSSESALVVKGGSDGEEDIFA